MDKCIFCDQASFKLLFKVENDSFELIKCNNCGLVFISSQPTIKELKKYYQPVFS